MLSQIIELTAIILSVCEVHFMSWNYEQRLQFKDSRHVYQ